jgi:hypothetical protein
MLRCDINARHRMGESVALGEAVHTELTAGHENGAGAVRKPYESPRLVRYGDVRDVTLGPTPGTGESGAPGVLRGV